jgi:hypothetical protein
MATNKNEIAEVKNTSLAATSMFEEDAGAGLEGADKSSYAIPFLTMLQGLSPQIETVDGAKPGLIINTITNELFSSVRVIPCAYQRRFIRWAPRSAGGGYKGEYNPIDVETGNVEGLKLINGIYMMDVPEGANAFDQKGLPLYDHLSDTRNHFVLVESSSGAWQPALFSMSSTQIKKSKRWMSLIQGLELRNAEGKAFNPPSFSHIYTVKGVKEENAKGSWWGVEIVINGPVEEAEIYANAKAFNKSVNSGAVEVAPPVADSVGEPGEVNKF